MRHFYRRASAVLLAACCTLAHGQDNTPPATARVEHQEIAHGDPARWYQPDTTPAEQLRTLRKEINAAYQEASIACKRRPAVYRPTCMKDAHEVYARDMANAEQRHMANNHPNPVR